MAGRNIRQKGQKHCGDHPGEELLFVCVDCKDKPLVCKIDISTTHSGHKFVAISLLVQEKYNSLQDLSTDTRDIKIPKVKSKLQAADATVKEITSKIQTQIQNVEDHGEYLKELINISTAETVSELKKISLKITKEFKKLESESDDLIRKLENLMKESHEATKTDNDILLLDVEKEISNRSANIKELEFTPEYKIPTFVSEHDVGSYIKAALGSLTYEESRNTVRTPIPASECTPVSTGTNSPPSIRKEAHVPGRKTPVTPISSASSDDQLSDLKKRLAEIKLKAGLTPKSRTAPTGARTSALVPSRAKPVTQLSSDSSKNPVRKRKLLQQPIVSQLRTCSGFIPNSLRRTQHGNVLMTINDDMRILHILELNGSMKTMKVDALLSCIDIHPQTDELYYAHTSYCEGNVGKLDTNTGKSTILFHLEKAPACLAVTQDSKIVIVLQHQKNFSVTLYSLAGTPIKTLNCPSWTGSITVCKLTGKVAIASRHEGVIVTDNKLQHLYTCLYKHGSLHYIEDAVFDDEGYLLLASLSKIICLDSNTGDILSTISTDHKNISCICLDGNGDIIVGSGFELSRVKYLSQLC